MPGDCASRILGYIACSLLFNVPYKTFLVRCEIRELIRDGVIVVFYSCATAVGAKIKPVVEAKMTWQTRSGSTLKVLGVRKSETAALS